MQNIPIKDISSEPYTVVVYVWNSRSLHSLTLLNQIELSETLILMLIQNKS